MQQPYKILLLLVAAGITSCTSGDDTAANSSNEPVLPEVVFTYLPETVYAGQEVSFDGSASNSANGEVVAWSWDFDGDGGVDAMGAKAKQIIPYSGEYNVSLTVTDESGAMGTATETIVVTVKLLER